MQDALHRVLLKTKEQILHITSVLYLLLGSPNVLSLADVPPKQLISFPDILRQTFQSLVPQFLRHPIKGFGNAAGDAGKGVAGAAGWLFDTLDKTLEMAKVTAEVTHNHPEGIKGAQATAAAIFLARTGHSKPEIRQYVEQTFGYDLNRTCDEIRPTYHHVETCQETVPEAIIAFLESVSFEDALRNAVSLGGDSDTLACLLDGTPQKLCFDLF